MISHCNQKLIPISELANSPEHYQKILRLFLDLESCVKIEFQLEPSGWPLITATGTGLDGEENQLLIYHSGYFKRSKYLGDHPYGYWSPYDSASLRGKVYSMLVKWGYDLDVKYRPIAKRYLSISNK
jgi:hypothetical protein